MMPLKINKEITVIGWDAKNIKPSQNRGILENHNYLQTTQVKISHEMACRSFFSDRILQSNQKCAHTFKKDQGSFTLVINFDN